jgi:hypothetical protein
MAGKKPAKRNVSNAAEAKVVIPGKAIKVLSYTESGFCCETCNKEIKKGIMYEHTNSKLYCSRLCIPKVEVV